jgi:hypothetical protein
MPLNACQRQRMASTRNPRSRDKELRRARELYGYAQHMPRKWDGGAPVGARELRSGTVAWSGDHATTFTTPRPGFMLYAHLPASPRLLMECSLAARSDCA